MLEVIALARNVLFTDELGLSFMSIYSFDSRRATNSATPLPEKELR